jgi:hypothetical protein
MKYPGVSLPLMTKMLKAGITERVINGIKEILSIETTKKSPKGTPSKKNLWFMSRPQLKKT